MAQILNVEERSGGDLSEPQDSSAETLFAALERMVRDGMVTLRLDYARLSHLDSPVGSEADGNIWAYGGLALAIAAWWFGGIYVALAVAVAGIAVYLTLGRLYMNRRIKRRVEQKALADLALWRQLWKFGGVTLMPAQGDECAAPQGNWMALVRNLALSP